MKCPECHSKMELAPKQELSLLGLGKWFRYYCEKCGGEFTVKRRKEVKA